MKRQIEILSPAGSYECLKAAIKAGADAVYVGGSRFGARAFADNFDTETMLDAIDYVHLHGKKIYLTINTLLKDGELQQELYEYLLPYYKQGIDAVIVQDIGVLQFVKKYFPDLAIHASTQMTVTNVRGAKFLERLGVERVVTAREMQISEIREIAEQTDLEIESFVHGALCYCYSGQCLYSSLLGGRSGNRGQCAQPCRLPYRMQGESKQQYLLSLKDICTLEYIPELIETGIHSFKIEGRMKKPEYVALVTAMYRKYLDLYWNTGKKGYFIDSKDKEMLMDLYNRGGFHGGYYHVRNGREMLSLERPNHAGVPVLRVIKCNGSQVHAKAISDIHKGDVIELPVQQENYTFANAVSKGQLISFVTHKKQRFDSDIILYRVRNEKLLLEIREKIMEHKKKLAIAGELHLSIGQPANLELSYQDISVTVFGDEPEAAVNQPMDKARIEKQMRKTGNTEFEFSDLCVHMADDLFMPMQSFNELRRKGIEKLQNSILERHRRQAECIAQKAASPMLAENTANYEFFYVYVEELEQLQEVMYSDSVHRIYVDANAIYQANIDELLSFAHVQKKELFIAFPHVFRKEDGERYDREYERLVHAWDGVLIRNLESYEFLQEHSYSGRIVADYNLYQFNCESKVFWIAKGLEATTAPLELNEKELMAVGLEESELIIYGHYPMMVSAQCIQRTTKGCTKNRGRINFVDRYQKAFTVKNQCDSCYNVIYNSTPVVLTDQKENILTLAPKALRLHFTIEDRERVQEILSLYSDVFLKGHPGMEPNIEFTRGHFKRGIK